MVSFRKRILAVKVWSPAEMQSVQPRFTIMGQRDGRLLVYWEATRTETWMPLLTMRIMHPEATRIFLGEQPARWTRLPLSQRLRERRELNERTQ